MSDTENLDNNTANPIDEKIEETHKNLEAHHTSFKNFNNPTYDALREDARSAENQIKGLNEAISSATPEGPTSEVMKADRENTNKAMEELNNGANPTDTYEKQATVSVTPPDPKKIQTITHDKYNISENNNDFNVSYDITTRKTGGIAAAMNDPTAILGANATERGYTYSEKTSNNKTTITTSQTTKSTNAPNSANIHIGNKDEYQYENTITGEYEYDRNKNLTAATVHRDFNTYISDTQTTAHKGEDLSTQSETALKEYTNVKTTKEGTNFSYHKTNKKGEITDSLTADLYTPRKYNDERIPNETYTQIKGQKYTYVEQSTSDEGTDIYRGYTAKTTTSLTDFPTNEQLTGIRPMEPKEAEKKFKQLKKETNKHVKELTGVNSMEEYQAQLGTPQKPHDLGSMWSDNYNEADAAAALESNKKLNDRYNNTPTIQMNINGTETIIPSPTQAQTEATPSTQPQENNTPNIVEMMKQNQGR